MSNHETAVHRRVFLAMISAAVASPKMTNAKDIGWDEDLYLRANPDVAEAVQAGKFRSGLEHYQRFGRNENRVSAYTFDQDAKEAMRIVCSLGNNCEVGMAQRAAGAEPIDLLRWADTPPRVLKALLSDNFANVGNPKFLKVSPSPSGEYYVTNTHYGFLWHAWQRVGQMSSDKIIERECKRLPYLGEKLLTEIREGSRLFVIKGPDITPKEVREVAEEISRIGPSTLLYVLQGAPPAVSREGDFLLRGTIPRYAAQESVRATLDEPSWVTVVEQATKLAPVNAPQ